MKFLRVDLHQSCLIAILCLATLLAYTAANALQFYMIDLFLAISCQIEMQKSINTGINCGWKKDSKQKQQHQ